MKKQKGNKESAVARPQGNTFLKFVFAPDQRKEFYTMLSIFGVLFVLLKIYWPYPVSTNDSPNYVLCAQNMTNGGYRPMGYSWLMAFVHKFTTSVHGLIFVQYLINTISTLYFVFTVKYFFKPANKNLFKVFAAFAAFCPGVLFCTNYVMSESFFMSLTLVWITTGLWIYHKQRWGMVVFHLILLFLCINIRYAGMFYPAVSLILFVAAFKDRKLAIVYSLLGFLVAYGTYVKVKSDIKKNIGFETFSAFGGWALANNATAILPHVDLKPEQIEDPEIRRIHTVVRSFGDTAFRPEAVNGTLFMWIKTYPGKILLRMNMEEKQLTYLKGWVYTGIQLRDYGSYLIKKYPVEYLKYFIWPNILKAFEEFDIYIDPFYQPDNISQQYFNLKDEKHEFKPNPFKPIYPVRIVMAILMYTLLLASIILFFVKRKQLWQIPDLKFFVLFMIAFIIMYMGFSIVSHPVNNFRYMLPLWFFQLAIPYVIINGYLSTRSDSGKA